MNMARGIVWIHSASTALCPHLEWALASALGAGVRLDWTPQPAQPGTRRCEYAWTGPVGVGAEIASALRGCQRARFEVTEDRGTTTEGMRWQYTPSLGLFAATVGVHGDILVPEQRLRAVLADDARGRRPLADGLADLLGAAWDDELEAFRHAGEDAPVRWLHRVG